MECKASKHHCLKSGDIRETDGGQMTTRLLNENVRAVWKPTAPRSPYTYGDFENSHDEKGGGDHRAHPP